MATKLLFDRTISLCLTGAESAVKAAFVAEARRQLKRVQDEAKPDGFRQFVDGRENMALETVKANGRIHFSFSYMKQVIEAALDVLESTSPIDTSHYLESHTIFIDGREASLDDCRFAKRVVIANTVPYARVIEVGRGKRVPWSKQSQVPKEGVYKAAVKTLRRTHGHIANISDTWVQVDAESGRLPALAIQKR